MHSRWSGVRVCLTLMIQFLVLIKARSTRMALQDDRSPSLPPLLATAAKGVSKGLAEYHAYTFCAVRAYMRYRARQIVIY